MAKGKKSTATVTVVKELPVTLIPSEQSLGVTEYTRESDDRGFKVDEKGVFTITPRYIASVKATAGGIGSILVTFEEKQELLLQYSLNFRDSYEAWKTATSKKSLPLYVHNYFDEKCPEKYGDPGTKTRQDATKSHVLRGAEKLIKRANTFLQEEQRKADLLSRNIDPNDRAKVNEATQKVIEENRKTAKEEFADLMVRFDQDGSTDENITDLLLWSDYVKKEGGLSKMGEDILKASQEALKAAEVSEK